MESENAVEALDTSRNADGVAHLSPFFTLSSLRSPVKFVVFVAMVFLTSPSCCSSSSLLREGGSALGRKQIPFPSKHKSSLAFSMAPAHWGLQNQFPGSRLPAPLSSGLELLPRINSADSAFRVACAPRASLRGLGRKPLRNKCHLTFRNGPSEHLEHTPSFASRARRFSGVVCCSSVSGQDGTNSTHAETTEPVSGSGRGGGAKVDDGYAGELDLGSDAANEPFYPLPQIRLLEKQLQAAVLEERYEEAASMRDELGRLRQGDEVLRLRRALQRAVETQQFEEAAGLRDSLVEETLRRCSDPRPLDRLLLLDPGSGGVSTCDPCGGGRVGLLGGGEWAEGDWKVGGGGMRYSLPVWSPCGDLVVTVEYTGTTLNSPINASNHIVVLQSRDAAEILRERVSYAPFFTSWASSLRLLFLATSLREHSKIVALDTQPQSTGAAPSAAAAAAPQRVGWSAPVRRSSTSMTKRTLWKGDLLFFAHAGGARGEVAVHAGADEMVMVLGDDPKSPTDPYVLSNRSGLFSAPQWHPTNRSLVIVTEETAWPRELSKRSTGPKSSGGDLLKDATPATVATERINTTEMSPQIQEMSQYINNPSPHWAGYWWRMNPVLDEDKGRGKGKGETYMKSSRRDQFGVIGQMSTAWERGVRAGTQQLVLAHVGPREGEGGGGRGRRVLRRLKGIGTCFGMSPDGEHMALLQRGRKGRQQRVPPEVLSLVQGPFSLEADAEADIDGAEDWVVNAVAAEHFNSDLEPARGRLSPPATSPGSPGRSSPPSRAEELDEESVLAFFWSPCSRKLLYLTSPAKDAEMYQRTQGMALRCRWNVLFLDTRETRRFDTFSPSTLMLERVIPNFQLFNPSIELWSPDSSRFCFAGKCNVLSEQGYAEVYEGAWVQSLEEEDPKLVAEGVTYVSWSPK